MKRITIILFLFLSIGLYKGLSAQMACKDTVFNVDFTENMCLFNIWGDWKVDSNAVGDELPKLYFRSEIWKFNSTMSYTHILGAGDDKHVNTAKYKFLKGYLELDDYTFDGSKVLMPITYKVIHISQTKMILKGMGGAGYNKSWVLFLSKLMY